MVQTRLESNQKVKYNSKPYNKFDKVEQWIRITDGCPNDCPFCYCPIEIKTYEIPKIVRNEVEILDMNILANPNVVSIFHKLRNIKVNNKVVYYNFTCGFDYRYVNEDIARRIKSLRVKKVRIAWDWFYKDQFEIKKAIDCFLKAGYRKKQIMVFMICNWKIPYEICCKKLDLLKIWEFKFQIAIGIIKCFLMLFLFFGLIKRIKSLGRSAGSMTN